MSINYEEKNTVSSKGQVNEYVYFDGKPSGTPRIMIIGNSITRHSPSPGIGWYGDWGMAASAEDKDYVHVLMAKVRERCPKATFCVVQAAVWERAYRDPKFDPEDYFKPARFFDPEIIVTAISANIPDAEFDSEDFKKSLFKLHRYMGGSCARLIQTGSFFNNQRKSEALADYSADVWGDYVYISDLPSVPKYLALGLFEHEGVQHHPSDAGMEEMASRIFEAVKKYI